MIDGTLVEDGVGPTFLAGSESDRGDSQAAGRRYAVGRERPLVHLRGLTEGGLAGRSSRDDKWVVGLEYPRREVLLRFKRQPGVSGTRVVENLCHRVLAALGRARVRGSAPRLNGYFHPTPVPSVDGKVRALAEHDGVHAGHGLGKKVAERKPIAILFHDGTDDVDGDVGTVKTSVGNELPSVDLRRDRSLVIRRAAPEDDAVGELAHERIVGPGRGIPHSDRVHVSIENDLGLTVADASNDVAHRVCEDLVVSEVLHLGHDASRYLRFLACRRGYG